MRVSAGGLVGTERFSSLRGSRNRRSGGLRARLCRGQQLGQADQVVSGGGQGEHPTDTGCSAMARLAQAGSLDPAKDLFDPLADPQADGVAGVAGGPAVDRRAAVAGVPGNVRVIAHRAG